MSSLIAIVDDDAPLRLALDNLIRSGGFRTRLFADAEAFLQAKDDAAVDLVVTDFQMGDMSGLDLLASLRSHGGQAPVVLMTAHSCDFLATKAYAAGAHRCLQKPFDASVLFEAIQDALGRPH